MLARLLNSAVAPPTGVAGALADLLEVPHPLLLPAIRYTNNALEVRPYEGVPRPELCRKEEGMG